VEPIVPLISSSVQGPLGASHLPRLWLKLLLNAVGRLPEGYRHGSGGLDSLTFADLGIEPEAFIVYVETKLPNYPECEAWVRQHATNIGPEAIAAHNAKLAAFDKAADSAAEFRARLGIADESLTRGIPLNDLDDWDEAHKAIVAAVSSRMP